MCCSLANDFISSSSSTRTWLWICGSIFPPSNVSSNCDTIKSFTLSARDLSSFCTVISISPPVKYPFFNIEPVIAFTAILISKFSKSISSIICSASLFNASTSTTLLDLLISNSILGLTSIPIVVSERKL